MIKSMAEDRHSLNVQLNFGYYIRGKENITATEMHERAHEVLFYNRMLVNQKHQRQLAYMLFDNFKNYMPVLTEHLKDVSQKCLLFGQYLGLKSQDLESLELAGLIHDIALTNLPLVVEHEMIHSHDFQRKAYKNHVKKGYEIAIETGLNETIASIILQHHEMYDGSGFPNHLEGDEINSFAQILSIVDFVDVYLKHNHKEGLEDALKSKINVAFSKELVYNMIAFLKIESNKGDHNGFN
jgi:HD-GYP domain-containing protein (c-di-GMP phosphodiesterase class II)